ncbi:hypothetical protein DFH06DRAFT_1007372, partial [Mycena polygramma]
MNCGTPFDVPTLPPLAPLITPLLTTNDAPTNAEIPSIESFLSSASERLDAVNKRIFAMSSALDVLKQERDTISADIQSHAAILSPIRNLPFEILSHIFLLSVPPLRPLEHPRAPWFLGQICRRWRAISTSVPILW